MAGILSDEIDLRAVFGAVWRRKLLLLVIVAIATGLALVYLDQATPRYTATAQVMIETREARVVEIKEVLPTLGSNTTAIKTQIEILRSRSLASDVIDRLALNKDPEINPALRPEKPGFLDALDPLQFLTAQASSSAESPKKPQRGRWAAAKAERRRTAIVTSFLNRLHVVPLEDTYVIAIRFNSEYPRKAALVANTVADLYLESQVKAKFDATRQATSWLETRIAELRRRVIDAETAVANYREQAGLIEGRGVLVSNQQLAELNTQLVIARTDRSRLEAQYDQLKRLLSEPGRIEAAPEVLNASLIRTLREQETVLLRKIAELSTRYRDHHPVMINARADLRDLRKSMAIEIKKIIEGAASQLASARARESALKLSLDELSKQAAENNRSEVRLRALEREVEATRTLYRNFLSRFKEVSEQEGLSRPDARIISRAFAPLVPSYPMITATLGLAVFGSALLGLLLIMLIEKLNTSFLSREQVEEMCGVRVLGLLPDSRPSAWAAAPPADPAGPGRNRKLIRWAFYLCVALVIVLSLVPNLGPPEGYDKQAHLLAYFVLAVLGMFAYTNRWTALAAAASLIGLAAAMELAQSLVPGRSASPEDFSAGLAGVLLGICIGVLARARIRRAQTADGAAGGLDVDFVESVRSVCAALSLPNGGHPPKVILVTSSIPEEGKTVLAAALARQIGRWGKKALLVDGDLRCPGLRAAKDTKCSLGLADLLVDGASFDDVVVREHAPGLDLVTAGVGVPAAERGREPLHLEDRLPALLGSSAMKAFLSEAEARYDHVIIDSPPLMTVSDARVASNLVSHTIFVLRWGKTRRNVALASLGQLLDAGGKVAGTVLTRVDKKKYAKYKFSDSGQFFTTYRDRYRASYRAAGAASKS